jgi:hypothetical protein
MQSSAAICNNLHGLTPNRPGRDLSFPDMSEDLPVHYQLGTSTRFPRWRSRGTDLRHRLATGEEEVLDTRTAGRELNRLGLEPSRAAPLETVYIAGLTTLAPPGLLLSTVHSLSFTPKER